MGLTYFKRYRMEIDLLGRDFLNWQMPRHYRLLPWSVDVLEDHAEVKFHSFRAEIDANVFSCFTEREGCLRLMRDISRKEGFLPEATWLAQYYGAGPRKLEFCGTIQGLADPSGVGAIQNIGVTPLHRGRGIGTRMIYRALAGFQESGMRRAFLEVTAQNQSAIDLYQRMGFRKVRTLYKAVEVAYS